MLRAVQNYSFIHHLPTEILLHTFLLIPEDRNALRIVCVRWETLITNTSEFWTTIDPHPNRWIPRDQYFPRLKFLIERASSSPTPVDIIWQFPLGVSTSEGREQVLYLLEHVPFSRWRSLEVLNWGIDESLTMKYIKGPALLQNLTLRYVSTCMTLLAAMERSSISVARMNVPKGASLNAFKSFPNILGKVKTLYIPKGTLDSQVATIYASLTALRMSDLPYQAVNLPCLKALYILDEAHIEGFSKIQAPLLEYLALNTLVRRWITAPPPFFHFPRLRVLSIQRQYVGFLRYFKSENLETLRLGDGIFSEGHDDQIMNRWVGFSSISFVIIIDVWLGLTTMFQDLRRVETGTRLRRLSARWLLQELY
jgi:hypothetical protein